MVLSIKARGSAHPRRIPFKWSFIYSFFLAAIKSILRAMRVAWELLMVMVLSFFSKVKTTEAKFGLPCINIPVESYCLSWRVAVEASNVRMWRTVPAQCVWYVEAYMLGGQYRRDIDMVVQQMYEYMDSIVKSPDGKDAWIFDVDDTCLSNLLYYAGKRFGGEPFDPAGFKVWAQTSSCPAIPAILVLFKKLIDSGFKVFLLTGRDELTLGPTTTENLHTQGFFGYERLILRKAEYRGQSAIAFKSKMRRQLIAEGFKIWGNVGDQWSDLVGDEVGDRTFKIPNPMYFVP